MIVEGARTPIGKFLGSFAETPTVELGAAAAIEALKRAAVPPDAVDQTIVGHARQAGNGPNTGRQVSIHAGVPEEVSAFNVNIACGSGMKAVQLGAQQIALGDAEVVLAGGMENMTRVPFLLDRMRIGYGMGDATAYDAMYRDGLLDPLCGLLMGETAENLVDTYDITREEQDEFALESQRKATSGAAARGLEIVPVEAKGPTGKGMITVTHDEHPRPDTSLEKLSQLKPAFKEDGKITAGNSSQVSDGAAAVLLMTREKAEALGLTPRARILDQTTVGVDPVMMLTGPIPATEKLLDRNGMKIDDIDLIEINEAFASVVAAWRRELDPDMDRVNVNGGAIALGHPLGSTGARLITTLLHELERSDKETGLVTMCCGGGLGTGTILQRV